MNELFEEQLDVTKTNVFLMLHLFNHFIKCKCLLALPSCIVENCFIILFSLFFWVFANTHAFCALTMIVELLKKSFSSI
jgi:hypothetical protein